jgi:DNA-binding transcriptional regulator YiaG
MTKCGRCGRERVVSATMDDSLEVCGHTFTATLPVTRCEACGQVVVQGHDMKLFELRIACELARAGLRTAASFKYLRESVQMPPASLADLLDVSEEFIGYWERGSWPVDPRAHAVLCSLVLAKYEHRPATLDCLAVLREPRKLARRVRVYLVDAIGQARKSLQFGSAARSAPALA